MKRWITKLVVFLILGAIVNVAVAWGCAMFSMHYLTDPRYNGQVSLAETAYFKHLGLRLQPREDFRVDLWEFRTAGRGLEYIRFREYSEPTRNIPGLASTSGFGGEVAVRIRSGWPLLAFTGESWKCNDGWPAVWCHHSAITLSERLTGIRQSANRFLPLDAVWPGFAINTMFYASIFWLPFAPFGMRRFLRCKRGLCIKCGYDLRGAEHEVCPECGVEV